jgi:hypothetical protein
MRSVSFEHIHLNWFLSTDESLSEVAAGSVKQHLKVEPKLENFAAPQPSKRAKTEDKKEGDNIAKI